MPIAARIQDLHTCPAHAGGPILPPGAPNVLIGGLPAAQVTNLATCIGPPDSITQGSPSVLICSLGAVRLGDPTAHGGTVSQGFSSVHIGNFGIGGALAFLLRLTQAVNPLNGTINCGQIIDSVVDRLTGENPDSTAVTDQDGTWNQIEQRHQTQIQFGQTFDDAFTQMASQPDGTNAIVGILYKNPDGSYASTSHVVVMTKQDGTTALIEGQGGGSVVLNAADAAAAYGTTSEVGIGIVGANP